MASLDLDHDKAAPSILRQIAGALSGGPGLCPISQCGSTGWTNRWAQRYSHVQRAGGPLFGVHHL